MDPVTEGLIVTAVTALAQLEPQIASLVAAWAASKNEQEKQVALARLASNVSVDAYQKIRNVVGK